ncbi:unnamed protein product [Medioppia subpectinata]|uniref:Uncharacterized protein n=1 Tax=Medioppia subpectinata TaxID=1979941 RepID=A0A7R9KXB7_9ACAR|nr:unnamed protein product [Medioppia subpectinata]CAG2110285.1 unnamed protein product [Medioppia subpectinata]
MKSIFKTLGLEYSSKVASMFALSPSKYVDLLSSTGSSAPVAAVSTTSASAATAEEVQEEESEDADIDF